MADAKAKFGILLSGLVLGKTEFQSDKGIRYNLNLAIPHQRENASVRVSPEEYRQAHEMEHFQTMATYSQFKGPCVLERHKCQLMTTEQAATLIGQMDSALQYLAYYHNFSGFAAGLFCAMIGAAIWRG